VSFEAALEKFEKRHPPHANPANGGEPFEVKAIPSPTSDHVRVQCGCGYMERYSFRELGLPTREARQRTNPG
jgi:hypothetical protein